MQSVIKQHTLHRLTPLKRFTRVLAILACAVAVSSCDVHGVSEPGSLTTLTVSPHPQILVINGTQQFTATGEDFAGVNVPVNPVWTVVAGGGMISSSGMFTAGTTPGTYTSTVQATSGGLSSVATVIVNAGALASIVVSPTPDTTAALGSSQFTAVGLDVAGNTVTIVPVWTVENGGGNINANTGVFTAGSLPGTFNNTIRATSGTISGSATATVTAGPLASIVITPQPDTTNRLATQQFTAVGLDVSGNVVPITPVWSIANGGGAINAGTGMFTAGGLAGTFNNTIRATSGSISGSATSTVLAGALASITVTPNPVSLGVGTTRQFIATGRDSAGNTMTINPTWSVINGGGAIASNGTFMAGGSTGSFPNTVQATSGTVSGTASVTVTAASNPPFLDLGAAAPNGIMAGTAVTCVTGGIIHADVSISPGNTLTGFGPCVINGVQHLADAPAAQAQSDLTTAYNTLAGMPCAPANAIVADLGGTTKPAGVYCTASGIGVTGVLTLDGGGDPNAVFVFQAGSDLTTAGDIVLINGAEARNVYWQVGTSATIGTASQWQGNILALTSITLVDNASLNGRALARNGAVTLGTNNVITLP